MAIFNQVNTVTKFTKSVGAALVTGGTDVLTNVAASGKAIVVQSIRITNIDGNNPVDITCTVYKAAVTTSFKLLGTISVAAHAVLEVLSRPLYLEEGDKINLVAAANGKAEAIISYDELY